jgi:hypothetical protein
MVNRYTLPFSKLNAAPFVDSIEDVTIEIPTLSEIGDAVARQTLDRTDVDESIGGAIGSGVDLTDEAIGDVVEVVEGSTGVDVPGEGSVVDEIDQSIDEAIQSGDLELPGVSEIDEIVRQAVTEELDLDDTGQVGINFEGVFGPLSQDIADALEEVINFDPSEFEVDVPSLSDIEGAIEDALDGLSPDVNGVEFWSDPIDFLVELVVESVERGAGPEVDRKLTELEGALEQ